MEVMQSMISVIGDGIGRLVYRAKDKAEGYTQVAMRPVKQWVGEWQNGIQISFEKIIEGESNAGTLIRFSNVHIVHVVGKDSGATQRPGAAVETWEENFISSEAYEVVLVAGAGVSERDIEYGDWKEFDLRVTDKKGKSIGSGG